MSIYTHRAARLREDAAIIREAVKTTRSKRLADELNREIRALEAEADRLEAWTPEPDGEQRRPIKSKAIPPEI